ncbi:hypothetical protein HN011_006116, partial [Eciton burchellii]
MSGRGTTWSWSWSSHNGVVYTYLACKHSRGLPEEQQVPTDTTAGSSWLYTSLRAQDT